MHVVLSSTSAVTHVDDSAQIHIVDNHHNPFYHKTIAKFDEKYSCPLIMCIFLNIREKLIVCPMEDSY